MSTLKKFTLMNFSMAVANVFSLLVSILVSRTLGPSGKGEYSAAIAITEIIIYLLLLGLGNGILYCASKRPSERKEIFFLASAISTILGILGTAAVLVLALLKNPVSKNIQTQTLLAISPIPLIAITYSNLRYLLFAIQRYSLVNLLNALAPFLQLLFLLALVLSRKISVFYAILAYVLSNLVVMFVQQLYIYKEVGIRFSFKKSLLADLFSIGLKSYLISLMTYIILRSDLIILNSIKGNYETGLYSVSAALAGKMLLITSPLYYILSPQVMQDPKSKLEHQLKISRHLFLLLILLLLIADVLYIPAVSILYGKQFIPSFTAFIILNPGIVFLGLIDVFSPYFLSKKYPPAAIYSPLTAALTNIALNLILIPKWGFLAAAATSSVSYMLYFLLLILKIKKAEEILIREALLIKPHELKEFLLRIANYLKKSR